MTIRSYGIAAMAASLLVSSAFAQDIEPNQTKAEATANGTITLTAGGTITGTTTGTTTTTGSTVLTTVDTYRVKTTGYAIGSIYEHRLTITSAVVGHTGSLRGLNQTGAAGAGGTVGTVDSAIQTSITTSTPPRFNQWYGFGRDEEIYYRVAGTATTTAAYTATLSTVTVAPTVIAPAFESAGPITITTVGQTTADTELMLYDSTGLAIVGGLNDDTQSPAVLQSTLKRTLAPGTYYLGVATFELCSNIVSPPDDNFFGGLMTDFPDCVVLSNSSLLTADWDFEIRACNGTHTQVNQRPVNTPYGVTWYQFTVAPGAAPFGPPPPVPANDLCASATAITTLPATFTGTFNGAANDGTSVGDPTGKDVWYSFTNTLAVPIGLDLNTCTTAASDTVITIYNTCGGAETMASDTCGGSPCGGPAACLTVPLAPAQSIIIRVSDKALSSCDFVLAARIAPPSNDDCSAASALPNGFGTFSVTNLGATTGTQGQAEPLCINVGGTPIRQDVWFTWTPTNSGATEITTCALLAPGGGSQDTKIAVYAGTGCPTSGSAIACNDDDPGACGGFATKLSFNAVCGTTYTIQFGMYQGTTATYTGGLMISGAGPSCSTPSTPECIGDTVAACPCSGPGGSLVPNPGAAGNGCANNTFANGANLSSSGVAVDNAGDTLVLTCSGMPGPGLFFQSNALGGPFVNFNDGILCAAVGIIRMGVVFPDGGGNASYPGGLTPAPIHIAGAPVLAPNPTKHYQCWYRDITPGFCNTQGHNMSNGIALTWAP